MPVLSQYANVHDTAVRLIERKGYQVWRTGRDEFRAEKDGWDFIGDDPLGLLGLIAIYEATAPREFREYWWRDDTAYGARDALPDAPSRAYVSITTKRSK